MWVTDPGMSNLNLVQSHCGVILQPHSKSLVLQGLNISQHADDADAQAQAQSCIWRACFGHGLGCDPESWCFTLGKTTHETELFRSATGLIVISARLAEAQQLVQQLNPGPKWQRVETVTPTTIHRACMDNWFAVRLCKLRKPFSTIITSVN